MNTLLPDVQPPVPTPSVPPRDLTQFQTLNLTPAGFSQELADGLRGPLVRAGLGNANLEVTVVRAGRHAAHAALPLRSGKLCGPHLAELQRHVRAHDLLLFTVLAPATSGHQPSAPPNAGPLRS